MTRDETHLRINDQLSIPLAELRFRFTPSSGPGGQHANRSATRVELFFDVANSPSLSETQRERVLAEIKTYIDGEGVLRLVSQVSRSQVQNRQEATARFQELLIQVLKPRKRRRATRVPRAERERRRGEKRRQSEKKQRRKPVPCTDRPGQCR
jgi:ribosome-associated protein